MGLDDAAELERHHLRIMGVIPPIDDIRVRGRWVPGEEPGDLVLGWGEYGEDGPVWLYVGLLGRRCLWSLQSAEEGRVMIMIVQDGLMSGSIDRRNLADSVSWSIYRLRAKEVTPLRQADIAAAEACQRLTAELRNRGWLDEGEVVHGIVPQELLEEPDLTAEHTDLRTILTEEFAYFLYTADGIRRPTPLKVRLAFDGAN